MLFTNKSWGHVIWTSEADSETLQIRLWCLHRGMFYLYCNWLYFFIWSFLSSAVKWSKTSKLWEEMILWSSPFVTCWLVNKSFLETHTWNSSWLLLNSDGSGFVLLRVAVLVLSSCFIWAIASPHMLCLPLFVFPPVWLPPRLDCLQLCSVPSCVSLCNQSRVVSSFPLWRDVFAPWACLCLSAPSFTGFQSPAPLTNVLTTQS